MNLVDKIKRTDFNFLPVIYDTRYAHFLSIYGRRLKLDALYTNIILNNTPVQITIQESPHYFCALEFLNGKDLFDQILGLEKELIADFLDLNKLIYSKLYIKYIKQAHPESDPILEFLLFINLIYSIFLDHKMSRVNIVILVTKKTNKKNRLKWLLVDGLHRSSILLALKEITVNARIKFI